MYKEDYIKNFKEETLKELKLYKKTPSDVLFVTDGFNSFSFDDFLAASDFEYDSGYGMIEINLRLKIIGDNWWFERYECEGLESWSYKVIPLKSDYPEKANHKMIFLNSERNSYSLELYKAGKK